MHYPVNVFVGKIRDYAGSRPSAIDKIQVDGELQRGDLGLDGDQQAEKKTHGGPSVGFQGQKIACDRYIV